MGDVRILNGAMGVGRLTSWADAGKMKDAQPQTVLEAVLCGAELVSEAWSNRFEANSVRNCLELLG